MADDTGSTVPPADTAALAAAQAAAPPANPQDQATDTKKAKDATSRATGLHR